jgi:hypothetical protein
MRVPDLPIHMSISHVPRTLKSRSPYDCCMAPDAYTGTGSVGDRPLAIVVELLRDSGQVVSCANSGLPGTVVHGEALQILQINDQLAVGPTQA